MTRSRRPFRRKEMTKEEEKEKKAKKVGDVIDVEKKLRRLEFESTENSR